MMEMRLVTAAMEEMSVLQKMGIYDRYVGMHPDSMTTEQQYGQEC